MSKKWAGGIVLAGIAISGAGGAALLSTTGLFQTVDLKFSDINFLLRGARATSNIVLVTIDQKALDTFPELLVFWHPYYAQAIRAVTGAGAKAVGLDVAFGVPVTRWEPNHDGILTEAVTMASATTGIVCGYVPALAAKQQAWPVPVNMTAAALGLSAYANLTVDSDDFVRRQELIEAPPAHPDANAPPLARSFALRLAEKFSGQESRLTDSGLSLGGHTIPAGAARTIRINYSGPAGTFPRYSLADVVAAAKASRLEQLASWFRGKAVLIGPDQIDDRHATPFYGFRQGSRWNTAGVEIHANTLRTLLDRDYLLPAPAWVRIASLLSVAAAATAASAWLPAGATLAGLLAIWAAAMAWSHALFRAGSIVSLAELLAASLLCAVGALIYRFSTAESRGDLFRRAVSVFVGRDLAASLEGSSRIGLSGTRQEVTVLFTDLRGFTAFCDSQEPGRVVDLLNEYFSIVVGIVMAYGGHVNKFLGDGMLAVFADSDASAGGNHATRAVQCARRIVMYDHPVFVTGAGIHSGPVVIGNIGSADKLEYTVLGDTVNLASRLESLNKEQKTRLLLSEETKKLLDSTVELVRLGQVAVRGKAAPVGLYTLAELVAAPAEPGISRGAV